MAKGHSPRDKCARPFKSLKLVFFYREKGRIKNSESGGLILSPALAHI